MRYWIAAGSEKAIKTLLVPIVPGLIRPIHRHADIVRLLLGELGEIRTDFLQV